ncbi:MAG: GGDEF domain-containing protein [Xanthomonadaceae bacterium]|nr:GGDEF domain-containing protein [Xanthomonadaceae bacterium]
MQNETTTVRHRRELFLYQLMSRLPLGGRYANKIILLSFISTHIPLLALLFYLLATADGLSNHLDVLLVALSATLAGFIGVLLLLSSLVAPISLTARSLNAYRISGTTPNLPTHYRDEVGSLMASVQQTTERLDALVATLHEAANTDELTGTLNRRAARRQLRRLIQRNREHGLEVSVALIDLDKFKSINDTFGHVAGDRLLRIFGVELLSRLRPSDWLARIGGDEFLLAMTGCSHTKIANHMQHLQQLLTEKRFEIQAGERVNLPFSFGVAAVAIDDDLEDVLERADTALYRQKSQRGGGK